MHINESVKEVAASSGSDKFNTKVTKNKANPDSILRQNTQGSPNS